MKPACKSIQTLRGRFTYREWGRENKNVIVLLHGTLQTLHTWDQFCEKSCDRFRLIALDQRGHGDSFHSLEKDYTADAMVEDLHHLLTDFELESIPFNLIGMSMGAGNALLFSSRYPKNVKSLVLVDWAPTLNLSDTDTIKNIMEQGWTSFDEAVKDTMRQNPQRTQENIIERLTYSINEKKDKTWGWKADTKAIIESRAKNKTNLWSCVETIKCPTLLLKGEKSSFVSLDTAKKFTSLNSNNQLQIIPNAGHSIQGDNPDAFFSAVMSFLERNSPMTNSSKY